jgi:hypothetical protein
MGYVGFRARASPPPAWSLEASGFGWHEPSGKKSWPNNQMKGNLIVNMAIVLPLSKQSS